MHGWYGWGAEGDTLQEIVKNFMELIGREVWSKSCEKDPKIVFGTAASEKRGWRDGNQEYDLLQRKGSANERPKNQLESMLELQTLV
jgi:hypothetical protein